MTWMRSSSFWVGARPTQEIGDPLQVAVAVLEVVLVRDHERRDGALLEVGLPEPVLGDHLEQVGFYGLEVVARMAPVNLGPHGPVPRSRRHGSP